MKLKSILFGLLLGVLLTISTTAVADSISKIGKVITNEYPVTLNGERISVDAVAFEGTSYLPVRVLSEKLGMSVNFKGTEISLTTKQTTASETIKTNALSKDGEMLDTTYKGLPAVEVNGEIYFRMLDYNLKFESDSLAFGYDSKTENIFLAEKESPSSSNVKTKLFEFNKNDLNDVIFHKGATHINVKHYREPLDLK